MVKIVFSPEAIAMAEAIDVWKIELESARKQLKYVSDENVKLRTDKWRLSEALKGLLADITEYQTINNLGGENNHWQVIARKVLNETTE